MDTPVSSPTPRLPVDSKLHYHTMPMAWLLSSLTTRNYAENPGRTLYTHYQHDLFPPHPHQTQGRVQCKNRQPNNASTQLPLWCPIPPGLWENFFSSSPPSIPGQPTKISLTWAGAWPEGGHGQVKGHPGLLSDWHSCAKISVWWLDVIEKVRSICQWLHLILCPGNAAIEYYRQDQLFVHPSQRSWYKEVRWGRFCFPVKQLIAGLFDYSANFFVSVHKSQVNAHT